MKVPKGEYYNVLVNSLRSLDSGWSKDLVVGDVSNYKLFVDAFIISKGINNTVDTGYTTASFVNDHYTGMRVRVYPLGTYLSNKFKDINLVGNDRILDITNITRHGIPPNEVTEVDFDIYNTNGDYLGQDSVTLDSYSSYDNHSYTMDEVLSLKNASLNNSTPAVLMLNAKSSPTTSDANYKELAVPYKVTFDGTNFSADQIHDPINGEEARYGWLYVRQMGINPVVRLTRYLRDDNNTKWEYRYYGFLTNDSGDYILYDLYGYTSPPTIMYSYSLFLSVYGNNMIDRFFYNVRTKEGQSTKYILTKTRLKGGYDDVDQSYSYSKDFPTSDYSWVNYAYFKWDSVNGIPQAVSEIVSNTGTYEQRGIEGWHGNEINTSSSSQKSLMTLDNIRSKAVKISDTCWVVNNKVYSTVSNSQIGTADNPMLSSYLLGDTYKFTNTPWGDVINYNNKILLVSSVAVVPRPVYVISKPFGFGEVVNYVLPYAYYEAPANSYLRFAVTGSDPNDVIKYGVKIGEPIQVNRQVIRLRVDMYTNRCDAIPKVYSYGVIALG